MAQRGIATSNSILETAGIDILGEVSDNELTAVNRIRLVSLIPAHIKRSGPVSGEQYEWKSAGEVVEVLEEDVESLLVLRLGESLCCGGSESSNYLFKRL